MLEHRGHRCHRKFAWEKGCGDRRGERFETYSQKHWLLRCPSQPLPPLCSWWQTSWWPCPWGHTGHSWCSGWAAHGHGPSWHDRYSSFSWSIKCTYQRQITVSLSKETLSQIRKNAWLSKKKNCLQFWDYANWVITKTRVYTVYNCWHSDAPSLGTGPNGGMQRY